MPTVSLNKAKTHQGFTLLVSLILLLSLTLLASVVSKSATTELRITTNQVKQVRLQIAMEYAIKQAQNHIGGGNLQPSNWSSGVDNMDIAYEINSFSRDTLNSNHRYTFYLVTATGHLGNIHKEIEVVFIQKTSESNTLTPLSWKGL
jgi:hypothetical protein